MKICTFNVLNLFLNLDKLDGRDVNTMTEKEWESLSPMFGDVPRNKSLYELCGLAQAILDIDADAFILPEVGGYNSLKNFNKHFLNSKYHVVVKEENSYRGIFVGYLIKKEYSYEVESFSHEKIKVSDEWKSLSRNLNLVTLKLEDTPVCHLLGVHLKSQRNVEKSKDIDFMDVREAELNKIIEIYERVSFNTTAPVFIGGDFNFDLMAAGRQESKSLKETDLVDIHTLKNSSEHDRSTFVFFQSMGDVVVKQQLDFLLFSSKHTELIDTEKSGTYYFKNEYGDSLGLPASRMEKSMMPSDHLPLVLVFNPKKD